MSFLDPSGAAHQIAAEDHKVGYRHLHDDDVNFGRLLVRVGVLDILWACYKHLPCLWAECLREAEDVTLDGDDKWERLRRALVDEQHTFGGRGREQKVHMLIKIGDRRPSRTTAASGARQPSANRATGSPGGELVEGDQLGHVGQ